MIILKCREQKLTVVVLVIVLISLRSSRADALQQSQKLPTRRSVTTKTASFFQRCFRRFERPRELVQGNHDMFMANNWKRDESTQTQAVLPVPPQTSSFPTQRGGGSQGSTKIQQNTSRRHVASNANELRQLVLDQRIPLSDIDVKLPTHSEEREAGASQGLLNNHEVLQLIARRYREKSKPSKRRRGDTARLALSLEGGGMRGAVSAGMAAAISYLGLQDSFDVVYGSSAGSCVGAYLVSQQLLQNRDLYANILTEAQRQFVCRYRIVRGLVMNLLDCLVSLLLANLSLTGPTSVLEFSGIVAPGMNLSFVLDSVMHPADGLRPLDLKGFIENDRHQPLRIVSSYVCRTNGTKLASRCFGTQDFASSPQRDFGRWGGIDKYLKASMLVPGAAGPPVSITTAHGTHSYFDAFCFEPLPYRSAVEEGATHVLVLCSRPDGYQPKTKPGIYERAIAPLYFEKHGESATARFFAAGGQQYLYAEDILTLEEGKSAGLPSSKANEGVVVPPPRIMYGVENHNDPLPSEEQRSQEWKRAHLLPLKVPTETPELSTLEQDQQQVLEAVRGGFVAAFDILAPIVQRTSSQTGRQVAEYLFPNQSRMEEASNEKRSLKSPQQQGFV